MASPSNRSNGNMVDDKGFSFYRPHSPEYPPRPRTWPRPRRPHRPSSPRAPPAPRPRARRGCDGDESRAAVAAATPRRRPAPGTAPASRRRSSAVLFRTLRRPAAARPRRGRLGEPLAPRSPSDSRGTCQPRRLLLLGRMAPAYNAEGAPLMAIKALGSRRWGKIRGFGCFRLGRWSSSSHERVRETVCPTVPCLHVNRASFTRTAIHDTRTYMR